jgi:hypothetical protein
MRTLINVAFLAGLLGPAVTAAGPVLAADLDHYYEPHPARMLPAPPPPCGYDRPCLRRHPRFGYFVPRYGYVVPPYHHVYDPYIYEHDGYGRPRENVDRYGYDRPPERPYEHVGFDRLDRYGDEERRRENERFERPRPDPRDLGLYGPG